jgi:hypothetical protein
MREEGSGGEVVRWGMKRRKESESERGREGRMEGTRGLSEGQKGRKGEGEREREREKERQSEIGKWRGSGSGE